MKSLAARIAAALGLLFAAGNANADDKDGGIGPASGTCVATTLDNHSAPHLTETFPERGVSGYGATLRIVVEHGKGERVFPRGPRAISDGDAWSDIKRSGFTLPDQDGGSPISLVRTEEGSQAKTVIELPLLVLSQVPGRNVLTLPPLPIAIARASGDVATLCTRAHTIAVEDPIAQTPSAEPRPNPPPERQSEDFRELRLFATFLSIGIIVGLLAALIYRAWSRRPKIAPPPPPPRPAWEVAREALEALARSFSGENPGDFVDRVNDVVRRYLGDRFHFDGLESTTDEIRAHLLSLGLPEELRQEVDLFLQESDLIKFANQNASGTECSSFLEKARTFVERTAPTGGRP